jgi:hypothetical protein
VILGKGCEPDGKSPWSPDAALNLRAAEVREEGDLSEPRNQDRAGDDQANGSSEVDGGLPRDRGELAVDADPLREYREFAEMEELMEEPTEGPLSIISDQDVPGEPG